MSHSPSTPALFCQITSPVPSRLKSPEAATCQLWSQPATVWSVSGRPANEFGSSPVLKTPATLSWAVPAVVPLVTHRPCLPNESTPLNISSLPTTAKFVGLTPAADAPEKLISCVPPGVPSVIHKPKWPPCAPLKKTEPPNRIIDVTVTPVAISCVPGPVPSVLHSPCWPPVLMPSNRRWLLNSVR